MFLDIYFDVGSILAFPVATTALSAKITRFPPPTSKIISATEKVKPFLDYVGDLDEKSLLSFTVNDWVRLVIILTLSFRLSFPFSLCPDFDSTWARSQIQLDQFLSKLSGESDSGTSGGMLSASRAVLGVLKSKYISRVDSLRDAPETKRNRMAGCPAMSSDTLNSIMAQHLPGLTHGSEQSSDSGEMPNMLPMFHDMWAPMGEGWQGLDEAAWGHLEIN